MSRVGGKYKDRKRNKVCVCAWCRQVFMSTRSDTKTCSDRCRKALSRHTSVGQFEVVERSREIVIKSKSKVIGKMELPEREKQERFFYSVT